MRIPAILTLLALLLLSACPKQDAGSPAGETPAAAKTAADASSRRLSFVCDPLLVPLLTDLEARFRQGYELMPVERGELLRRIAEGDRFEGVDVFAYGDLKVTAALTEAGLISEPTQRIFAGDRLALISREGESWKAASLFDIYRLRFKKLGIGSTDTLGGYYAEQALVSDGVMPRVEERLSHPASAQEVADELLDKGSEMAILPRSFVPGLSGIKLVLLIDRSLHEPIQYRVAGAAGMEEDAGVMALLTMLAEDPEVQALLPGYSFDNRVDAMEAAGGAGS